MNDLRKLIADWLAAHPGENYRTIADRGGLHKSTVQQAATFEERRQSLQEKTVAGLARGMGVPVGEVRKAAGAVAGYKVDVPAQMDSEEGRLIVAAFKDLDDVRKAELAARARALLDEMRDAGDGSGSY